MGHSLAVARHEGGPRLGMGQIETTLAREQELAAGGRKAFEDIHVDVRSQSLSRGETRRASADDGHA